MENNLNLNDYKDLIKEIKSRIQNAQLRAVTKVNQEMLLLYWEIGKMILDRQEKAQWGEKIIKQISKDLKQAFPGMKGFSERNLKYMKRFAQENNDFSIGQEPLAQITWYHNIKLITKVPDRNERLWYAQKAVQNGWSTRVMEAQIESNLYERQGKAITNFNTTLPSPESDLAQQALKDPYNFDFLTLTEKVQERDIEKALVDHITHFLLELGKGFAFVGKQYEIKVNDNSYFIDLLFYHLELRCYVVIELKNHGFKPEYAGKINFYLNVVNDTLKHEQDKPTIGIILCKDDKGRIAEVDYALKNINQPIGVSDFKISSAIPEELKSKLPTIEDIEREFDDESE